MNNWFECKISFEKEVNSDGLIKKVSESYLVDAMSFTEAETRILTLLADRGEFVIDNLKKVKYIEVFLDARFEKYFKAKVGFISLDEKAGVEKRKYVQMLVQANTIQEALEGIDKGMKGTISDYEVAAIAETTLVEVYPE